MKTCIITLSFLLFTTLITKGQSVNQLRLQAGYLYTTPELRSTSTVLVGYPDLTPKPGYYVGLSCERQFAKWVSGGLELMYQQKGHIIQPIPIFPLISQTYRYLSLTPQIGFSPVANLRLLIGPQLNFLINQSTKGGEVQAEPGANRTLELGLLSRVNYQVNRVGLIVGYFQGLTPYFKPAYYEVLNQNWQVGLSYQLN